MKPVWLFIGIGGALGPLVPMIFGAGYDSGWGILAGLIGSLLGIYVYYKLQLS